MEMDGSVLDIEAYRTKKQVQGEENARKLYEMAYDFTDRNANIREKVRAKHLFRKFTGLEKDAVLPGHYEKAFSEWFLFDYTTIQGLTMFNLFLKNNVQSLSESELIQGALFLTSVLEPIQVIGINSDSNELYIEEPYSRLRSYVHIGQEEISRIDLEGFYLLRRIPIVKRDMLLGSIYPIGGQHVLQDMKILFKKEEANGLGWRGFLKRHAVEYLSDQFR